MFKSFAILATLFGLSTTALADGKITGTVDAKPSKFLKDTIVYVKQVPNTKLTAKTVEIDQKGMEFSPHIVLLAVGDTVKFQNHDNVDHNVMSHDGGYDSRLVGRRSVEGPRVQDRGCVRPGLQAPPRDARVRVRRSEPAGRPRR